MRGDLPESFYCALTHEVMNDPVIDPEGHTFERSAITTWLSKSKTSPITRKPLQVSQLVPNRALREAIERVSSSSASSSSPPPFSVPTETQVPGLRVYQLLCGVVIRPRCVWTKPSESSATSLSKHDVVATTALARLPDGRIMAELEDGSGWIPLFDSTASELESVLCVGLPMERGHWRYSVSNGETPLALRSRPDSSPTFVVDRYAFPTGTIIHASHRVVGAHGNVYVRVIGYPGWLFESRRTDGKIQRTLIPLTCPELSFFQTNDRASPCSSSSSSSASPSPPSFDTPTVRQMAAHSGLAEILFCPASRVISFVSRGWPKQEDCYRVNVFYTTRTVSTVFQKKQLFRRSMTLEELREVFLNPRASAEKGYYTAAEVEADLDHGNWEFDAFHLAHTEEQTILREEQVKQSAARAEAERKQKEQLQIAERGLHNTSWLTKDVRAFVDPSLDMARLKGLCFAGTDVVAYHDNSSAWWSGLPQGRLYSLLKGRGGGKSNVVDLLVMSISPDDQMSFYVRFSDGCSFWDGLPQALINIILKDSPIQLALGFMQDSDDDHYDDDSSSTQVYIVQTAKAVHWSSALSIHSSWFDNPASFSLGPQGEYFVRLTDGQRIFSGTTSKQRQAIHALEHKGHKITQIAWGLNSSIFVRYQ